MSVEIIKGRSGNIYRVKVMRNGKRISKNFRNRRDALLFEKDILIDDAIVNAKEYLFKDAAKEWLKLHAEIRKSCSGLLMDNIMLNKNIFPSIGDKKINSIQPHHIDALIGNLLKRGLSHATVNRNLCVVRTIFNYCRRRRLVFNNPMDAVPQLKCPIRDFKFWSLKDARTFLEYTKKRYASGERYSTHLLYLVALNTGMRLGELLALNWQDVDFENRIITVKRVYSCHERKVNDRTKGGRIRHVPINSAIYEELKKASKIRESCEWVFHWDGKAIDPHNMRARNFMKDVKESGVDKIRFHDLRHTFASHYMMNGGNPYDLQKILGHSSLRMTERYAHLSKAFLASKGDTVSFTDNVNVIHVNFKATGTQNDLP